MDIFGPAAGQNDDIESGYVMGANAIDIDKVMITDTDETPLMEKCRDGDTFAIKLLLEAGANVKAEKNGKQTCLHLAAAFGRPAAVKMLFESHADIERRSPRTR